MLCITQSFPVSGAQWEKAVELFDQMQSKGCKPDSVTYGGLILAYEKGDQWRRALAAFDQMKSNNCRPDSVVYNTVVGVLWNTGVVWAQAKAVQVHRHAPVEACSAAKLDWRSINWCRYALMEVVHSKAGLKLQQSFGNKQTSLLHDEAMNRFLSYCADQEPKIVSRIFFTLTDCFSYAAQHWPSTVCQGFQNKASYRHTLECTRLTLGKDTCPTTKQTNRLFCYIVVFHNDSCVCAGFPDGLQAGSLPSDSPH